MGDVILSIVEATSSIFDRSYSTVLDTKDVGVDVNTLGQERSMVRCSVDWEFIVNNLCIDEMQ